LICYYSIKAYLLEKGFMKPSTALQNHREEVRRIALSHRVKNVRVFGSVTHGEDTEEKEAIPI
jgi:hypothetical protein